MAQSKTVKSSEYDTLVIGSGLTGLIAAHLLEGTDRKVALIEGLDAFGGSSRPVQSKAGTLDHGWKFLPDSPEARETIAWLEGLLGEKIPYTPVEAPPLTYDDGKFKPFVGFGDQAVATATEIAAYACDRYLELHSSPKDWVPRLIESFTGTSLTQSYATKMLVDEEFVIDVVLNGAKHVCGREIVFCAEPTQLARLLPESHSPAKLRQKLLKGDLWTSVNLDLIHKGKVTDSRAVHVLRGANEEPCVGVFHPAGRAEDGSELQVSQWLTLVPRNSGDEPELVASALKQIKRQVKRAYETALEGLIQERIVVSPTSHGDLTSLLPESGAWPRLQNLWLISGLLHPAKNLLGSLLHARRIMKGLIGEVTEPIAAVAEAPRAESALNP